MHQPEKDVVKGIIKDYQESRHAVKGFLFSQKLIIPPSKCVVCHTQILFKTHLSPAWKLHFDTCKDEIKSPLQ